MYDNVRLEPTDFSICYRLHNILNIPVFFAHKECVHVGLKELLRTFYLVNGDHFYSVITNALTEQLNCILQIMANLQFKEVRHNCCNFASDIFAHCSRMQVFCSLWSLFPFSLADRSALKSGQWRHSVLARAAGTILLKHLLTTKKRCCLHGSIPLCSKVSNASLNSLFYVKR